MSAPHRYIVLGAGSVSPPLLGEKTPRMIAISGYGLETDRHRCRERGFDAHLVRPVDWEKLLQAIEGDMLQSSWIDQRDSSRSPLSTGPASTWTIFAPRCRVNPWKVAGNPSASRSLPVRSS